MASRLPNLTWIRTFETAARLKNFTVAGEELGLTQTAVSLHIKSLEAFLDCKLFVREPRNLRLTSAGEAYLHSVERALSDLRVTTASMFGTGKQVVTVCAPISTTVLLLTPKLPAFAAAYPEIHVRLVSTIWANSASDEDIDVDVRLGIADQHKGAVQFLSSETATPIAGLKMSQQISKPESLLTQPLVHVLGYEDNWMRFFSAHNIATPNTPPAFSVDTSAAALALAEVDAGCAIILTRFVNQALSMKRPIKVIGDAVDYPLSHFIAEGKTEQSRKAEVDIVRDWLKGLMSRDEAGVR